MVTESPFSTISDETLLIEIIYSPIYTLPFNMYKSVYFESNNYAAKYDAVVSQDHISQGTEVECMYFNIDGNFLT